MSSFEIYMTNLCFIDKRGLEITHECDPGESLFGNSFESCKERDKGTR